MMKDFDEYQEDIDNPAFENFDDSELDEMPPLPEYDENLDHEYEEAKASIDFSRTEDEQAYWQNRADELWKKRDEADFQARNNKK